jgi:hypothetical protein
LQYVQTDAAVSIDCAQGDAPRAGRSKKGREGGEERTHCWGGTSLTQSARWEPCLDSPP